MPIQNHKRFLTLSTVAVVVTVYMIYLVKNNIIHLQPGYGTFTFDIPFVKKHYGSEQPHQHVFYFKTHKTGSTTIHNILAEYCRYHDLIPLLPTRKQFNQEGKLKKSQILRIPQVPKYDMVFSHHIYSPDIFEYLHNDSVRITSLREPYDNFVSAFLYFKNKWHKYYLDTIPTKDPVTEFLRHPKKYEVKGHKSFTNNRQSMDLGFDLSKSFYDTEYIKEFIKLVDSRFDFVIITEYFDEGLVMMKRMLRWNTEDIIYYNKNAGKWYKKDGKNRSALDIERRELHAKFSKADIMLYDYFLKRFKKQMAKERGLQEEVEEFRTALFKLRDYCNSVKTSHKSNVVIPAGRWTNRFQISRVKCQVLSIDYYPMTELMQKRQKSLFPKLKA